MNCNGKYSDGRYGKLRNGCPHSEIRSFRQPSALRKRRHPANRKSLRNIRSKAFYGMDIQERSSLPLAAFYICFWQLYPVLHRRTSETRLPKRALSEASAKAGFGGDSDL